MTIYVDQNISYRIACALECLSSQMARRQPFALSIVALRDSPFGADAADEEWIPRVALADDWIFTQDVNIRRRRQQVALLQEHGTNVIYLQSSAKTNGYWRMVRRAVGAWEQVLTLVFQHHERSHNAIEIGLRDDVMWRDYRS